MLKLGLRTIILTIVFFIIYTYLMWFHSYMTDIGAIKIDKLYAFYILHLTIILPYIWLGYVWGNNIYKWIMKKQEKKRGI